MEGSKQFRLIVILGSLGALAPLSIDMYVPALPQLARDLHTSASELQLTLTACLVGLAAGQLIAGPFSDRFGRRQPLFAGLALYATASLACAFAPSVMALTGLRLVQALSGATGIVISRAAVRDSHSGTTMARFFSVLMLVNGLAPVLAPVVGGQILRFTSWRGVFVVLAAIGAAMLVASWLFFPETLPAADRTSRIGMRSTLREFRQPLRDREFIGYALVAGLSFAALFAYISDSSFVFESVFGLSPQEYSVVFALNSAGLVLASQLNGLLLRRFTPRQLLASGSIVMAASSLALLADALVGLGIFGILVPLFVIVAGAGMLMPNAAAMALTNYPRAAGSASGLLGFAQFVIGGAVAPLVSLSRAHSAAPMAGAIVILALAALLALAVLTRGPGRLAVTTAGDIPASSQAS